MNGLPIPSQILGSYLITGSAGIGKTTIAKILALKGYNAVDADKHYGEWVDRQGNPVEWRNQNTGTQEWMKNHRWIYSPNAIRSAIKEQSGGHLFVCGVSRNQHEFYHLFHKVFFLHAGIETIIKRLDDPGRDHQFGKEPHQQLKIRQRIDDFIQEYKSSGAVFIDASKKPIDIVSDILRRVDTK